MSEAKRRRKIEQMGDDEVVEALRHFTDDQTAKREEIEELLHDRFGPLGSWLMPIRIHTLGDKSPIEIIRDQDPDELQRLDDYAAPLADESFPVAPDI